MSRHTSRPTRSSTRTADARWRYALPLAAWQDKEGAANAKRRSHIEEVAHRHRREAQAAASEEARKQAMWDERRKQRAQEEKAAARKRGQPGDEETPPLGLCVSVLSERHEIHGKAKGRGKPQQKG